MTTHCILIVDDQHDVRRMLRAGLETLGPDFKVVDVPSGEEAMLVISRQPIDILVADVRLPGISGLELRQRAQLLNPNLKLILITGMADPKIRRQVSDSGADAYFFKPMEMPDFLSTVERCLGLTQANHGPHTVVAEPAEVLPLSLSDRISTLRHELDAISVLLLDDRGRVVAQAGGMPDAADEANLIPVLMATFGASKKVSSFIGKDSPQNLLYFAGVKYDLYLSAVSYSMAMLVVTVASGDCNATGKILDAIRPVMKDLISILENQNDSPPQPVEFSKVISELQEEPEGDGASPELDSIFSKAAGEKLRPEEIAAFWDTLSEQNGPQGATGDNYLTFEQARRLGLAPRDEVD